MIALITQNKWRAAYITRKYRLLSDDWRYISSPNQLRGLPPQDIIMIDPEWWMGKKSPDIDEIKELIDCHDNKCKKGARPS